MKKLFEPIVLLLLCIIVLLCYQNYKFLRVANEKVDTKSTKNENLSNPPLEEETYQKGMYSWEDSPYVKESKKELYSILKELEIDEFYQSISDKDLDSDEVKVLPSELAEMGIELYYMAGDSKWGLDPEGTEIKNAIDKALSFNKLMGEKPGFRGIVLDVEPFTDKSWNEDQEAVMQAYVSAMTKGYQYAESEGLRVIICIPNWYDVHHKQQLETLIASACDEVAVMNYNRREEIVSMESEVAFAQKYEKTISCIFEFQAPGTHELTDNETYYNAGLEVGLQNFEILRKNLGYEKINFAYHYYKPVKALLKKSN